ncbi:beta galactosidase 1 [Actinidia rufa]|uniref:Beta galactosidase 1 n=1 Tax=Actinidia rufa TaxID=165716 RepID=A0A7J0FWN7_9ERIC|nr:beta galactosidase 1 [Actinidia rufa]
MLTIILLVHYHVIMIKEEKGKGPLSVNLASMGKGQAWVNGQRIGRYWPAYLSPSTGCSEKYHIPRTWVHPGENLLVTLQNFFIDTIRARGFVHVSEADPPPADAWKPMSDSCLKLLKFDCRANKDGALLQLPLQALELLLDIVVHSSQEVVIPVFCQLFSSYAGLRFAYGLIHASVLSFFPFSACIGKQGCSIPVGCNISARGPMPWKVEKHSN